MLDECMASGPIPPQPGLYRIRRGSRDELDYIGETGNLRERMKALREVYGAEMPFAAPHTAAPGLWALLREGARFEVSFALAAAEAWKRKGVEAAAIALYRQQYLQSPSLNFGRMPQGYFKSSGRNAKLRNAGRLLRGGPTTEELACHQPSVEPAGPLTGEPGTAGWGGHRWSAWEEITSCVRKARGASGLYRIRAAGGSGLLYVGEGAISDRLREHLKKRTIPEHAQGKIFREAGTLEVSCVVNAHWKKNQLVELENDLIAAHVLVKGAPPLAQFTGGFVKTMRTETRPRHRSADVEANW